MIFNDSDQEQLAVLMQQ